MKKHTIKASFWEHPLVYYPLCAAFCAYDYNIYFNLLQRCSTLPDSSIRLYSLLGVGLIDIGVAMAVDFMRPHKRRQRRFATILLFSFAAFFASLLVYLAYTNTAVDAPGVQFVNNFVNQASQVVDVAAEKAVMLLSAFSTIASTVIISALTIYRKNYKLARALEDAQLKRDDIILEIEGASYFADPHNVEKKLLPQAKTQALLKAKEATNEAQEAEGKIRSGFAKASAIDNVTEIIRTTYPVSEIKPLNLSQYEADSLLDDQKKCAERAIAVKQQQQKQIAAKDVPHTTANIFSDILDEPVPDPVPEPAANSDPDPVPDSVPEPAANPDPDPVPDSVPEPVPDSFLNDSDECTAYLDYEEDDSEEVPA